MRVRLWGSTLMAMLVCRETAADELELKAGSVVRFASVEEGRRILGTRDDFVASLSAFDRSARLRTGRDVNTEKYLKFVSAQVLAWEDAEIQKLRSVLESIGKKLSRFRISRHIGPQRIPNRRIPALR